MSSQQTFTLPRLMRRDGTIERIARFLAGLSESKAWQVKVEEAKPVRSGQQNRYLWGVCYPEIMKHLPGWEAEDVHEYCLGECFGWEELTGLSRKRLKPLKRSSRLSKTEFADYVDWMQRNFAAMGIYIPDPNEVAA